MRRRTLVIIGHLAIAAAGCTDAPPPEPQVAEAKAPVGQGDVDNEDNYPYVAHLKLGFDGETSSCTGILITPTWILTAGHCVIHATPECSPFATSGEAPKHLAPVTVRFDPWLEGSTPADKVFKHTLALSGEIITRIPVDQQIDSCSDQDSAKDVALVKLNKRVSISNVAPLHPPLNGVPRCRDVVDDVDFDGTLVGYGPTDIFDPAPDPGQRSFNNEPDWELDNIANGESVYFNDWDVIGQPGPFGVYPTWWYGGATSGDSGGPLLSEGDNGGNGTLLCGVTSRSYPTGEWTVTPIPVWIPQVGTDTAAIDSENNMAFLAERILDSEGRFMGECDEGPANERDIDSDDDLIPDACDVCPVFAVRDPITGENNYDLSGGNDWPDFDGIPEQCDNCPSDPNPNQFDFDEDGIGNECDDCPYSDQSGSALDDTCCDSDDDCGPFNRCSPVLGRKDVSGTLLNRYPWLQSPCGGRCVRTIDEDKDGSGNSCDSCPGIANPNDDDTDVDGVGDKCDDCPGSPYGPFPADVNPFCDHSMSGDAICESIEPGSRCVPPRFAGAGFGILGDRCTLGKDTDNDGVGDRCDNCATVSNPYESFATQPNCNLDMEVALGDPYPFTGDACDPMPCATLQVSEAPDVPCGEGNQPPCPGGGAPYWVKLGYVPNLLPKDRPGAFQYAGNPAITATAGSRVCNCDLAFGWPDAATCAIVSGCVFGTDQYDNVDGVWKVLKVHQAGPTALPPSSPDLPGLFPTNGEIAGMQVVDPVPPPTHFAPPVNFAHPSTATKFADALVGNVPVFGELVGKRSFWTHVTTVTNLAPSAAAAALVYGERSNHYQGQTFQIDDGKDLPQFIELDACHFLKHLCPNCPIRMDMPNWVYDPITESVFLEGVYDDVNMTDRISPEALSGMTKPDVKWVGVSELDGWLDANAVVLASVSDDGSGVGMVLAHDQGAQQVVVVAEGSNFEGQAAAQQVVSASKMAPSAAKMAPSAAPVVPDFAAVLSARERMLFIIGGLGQEETPTQDVRAYDIKADRWSVLPLDGEKLGKVLAATYRAADRSLYVLDEVDSGSNAIARLVRIQLDIYKASVEGSWARPHPSARVFISVGELGELVVFGNRTAENIHRGVVLRRGPGGVWTPQYSVQANRLLALAPTMTAKGITLPRKASTSVINTFIPRISMDTTPDFGIASCL